MPYKTIELFEKVFKNSPVGLVIVNKDVTIRDVNNYMFSVFNMPEKAVAGQGFGNIFRCAVVTPSGKICGHCEECKKCNVRNGITDVLNNDAVISEAVIEHYFHMDGQKITKWFKLNSALIKKEEDTLAIVSFVDITAQKEIEQILNNQLSLDLATGTTNKHTLLNLLEKFKCNHVNFSIAMIDFDDFKKVNDNYGHVVGDRVLNIFCTIASINTRENDILGRFGGEEFMMIFPSTASEGLTQTIKRISDGFKEACEDELHIRPTFSVGVAEFSANQVGEMNIEQMIALADKNLYKAKENGKNQIVTQSEKIVL